MSAHTPGPWEIRSRHESSMDHTTVTRYLAIPGHDYISISRIVDPTPEQDETARANARLLATAPDLLATLKALVALCDVTSSLETDWERAVSAGQAAIAKAEVA